MRASLILLALSLSLTLVACDFVPLDAIQPGGKCHNVDDGSVLKSVEDINGKRWPVEQFPQGAEAFGISGDRLCAVPVQAKEFAFVSKPGFVVEYHFLHPETGDRIEAVNFGSYQGFINLDWDYEWY